MGTKLRIGKIHKDFGKKVARLRKEKNMTQEDLCDLVGIDRSYIGFVERGERNVTLDKIDKIAKALNIKPSKLFD